MLKVISGTYVFERLCVARDGRECWSRYGMILKTDFPAPGFPLSSSVGAASTFNQGSGLT